MRIVSFFITARLAAQDTREAFTEVLLEQLAELTGQDLPTVSAGGDPGGVPAGPAGRRPPVRAAMRRAGGWYWWWMGWMKTVA